SPVPPGSARVPRRRHGAPQERGRLAKVADDTVGLSQVQGALALQGAVAERLREFEGLSARYNGPVIVARQPEYSAHRRQHVSQPRSVVERSGQGLGFT